MGTALCTFFNTLGSTLSVGIFAAVYNRQVAKAASSVVGIQEGFHMLALTVILIEAIGFVIALVVMPRYFKENPTA
jgi:hypothetical protein